MKYHNKKTEINGILFDSKLEAKRYQQLILLECAGEISELKLQPEFQILFGFMDPKTGEKIRSRFYVGDFFYIDKQNQKTIVEDVKGLETPEFRLKWDYVRSLYPQYEFIKVTRSDI